VIVVDRITAEDRLMLWPDQMWPQDVGALAVIDGAGFLEADGRFRLEAARAAVENRLHLVPRFRQVLYTPRRGGGWPLWLDDRAFDLPHHVGVAQVPVPGDEAQLLQTVERLRRRRLDWSRPPWEMWFSPVYRAIVSACSSGSTTWSPTASPAWQVSRLSSTLRLLTRLRLDRHGLPLRGRRTATSSGTVSSIGPRT
jgi:hypothetical protein